MVPGERKSLGGGNTEARRKGITLADKCDPSRNTRLALVPSRQREHPTLRALRASLANTREPALRDRLTAALAMRS